MPPRRSLPGRLLEQGRDRIDGVNDARHVGDSPREQRASEVFNVDDVAVVRLSGDEALRLRMTRVSGLQRQVAWERHQRIAHRLPPCGRKHCDVLATVAHRHLAHPTILRWTEGDEANAVTVTSQRTNPLIWPDADRGWHIRRNEENPHGRHTAPSVRHQRTVARSLTFAPGSLVNCLRKPATYTRLVRAAIAVP